VDPDPSARQDLLEHCPDATGFAALKEALKQSAADVIHICTPPDTHESLARTSLAAGRHVYVEKPFAQSVVATEEILALAESKKLKVCAGHQLLYEAPARIALGLLPSLGTLVHVESYFSFRSVRRSSAGAAITTEQQLLDIMPHPVYSLLQFLAAAEPDRPVDLGTVEQGPGASVHLLVRRGSVSGMLVVTLEGRPIESYLRLVGTNGTVHADFLRGSVQRLIGPGSSGIDKLLNPFRLAWQLSVGTMGALVKRALNRQRSYPGLLEIVDAFYHALETGAPSPITPENILETVKVCEVIARCLKRSPPKLPAESSAVAHGRDAILITGGTGFLGSRIAAALKARGMRVHVLSRRRPAVWERIPQVQYVTADLSRPLDPVAMGGVSTLVHVAAETVGAWEEHERNSIRATENVLRTAAAAGVRQVLHVSSIAVLATQKGRSRINEEGAFEPNPRRCGPYVWGKLESEKLARKLAAELDLKLRIVRPGALVDYQRFDPPGRLGKRVGNIFVAVGSPREKLAVADVTFSADIIAWIVARFEAAPRMLHITAPELPTKRELVARLRHHNPGLRVIWLPRPVLVPLSWVAIMLQKVLRPRQTATNLARIFQKRDYDTSRIAAVTRRLEGENSSSSVVPRDIPVSATRPC
jgi:predicted dehydrogenase/nucleoside-diphosphate-sugar epimerase